MSRRGEEGSVDGKTESKSEDSGEGRLRVDEMHGLLMTNCSINSVYKRTNQAIIRIMTTT